MNSNEINKFAQTWGIEDFIGVFAVDQLTLIPKSRTGYLIQIPLKISVSIGLLSA